MAKEKIASKEESQPAPTAAQVASAVKSVMAIIGCGRADAKSRVGEMPSSKVIEIAKLEDTNKRKDVVTLLYS